MSRKYSQRGYLDDGSPGDRSGRRAPGPRGEPRDGPRGRGLGAPTATVFRCARCGERQSGETPSRDTVCAACGSDLHTCTHCAHFDTSAPLECRKPIDQRVGKKDARNSCDHFEPKQAQEFAAEAETPRSARSAFDDLFKL